MNMDPLFVHAPPFVQVQRQNVNGYSPTVNTSPVFSIGHTEESDDSMATSQSLANNFASLSLNIPSQARKDVPPIPAQYCFPNLMPFIPSDLKTEFIPNTFPPIVVTNQIVSKSQFGNIYSENADDNSIPTIGYTDLSAVVPEFVPRSALKNKEENPILNMNGERSMAPVDLLSPDSSFISSGSDIRDSSDSVPNNVATFQENVNGTTYFYTAPVAQAPPTAVVPGTITPPASSNIPITSTSPYSSPTNFSRQINIPAAYKPYYMPSEIPSQNIMLMNPANSELYQPLPDKIGEFYDLSIIEANAGHPSISLPGYIATMYKGTHCKSGITYCLRRIHDTQLTSVKCNTVANVWKKLNHTNLIQLNDVFTTTDFGDNSVVFVYEYYENSETVMSKHFPAQFEGLNGYMDTFSSDPNAPRPYSHTKNSLLRQQHSNVRLPENALWSYAIQLIGALKVVHGANLSCRCIDPTKVVLTSSNRIRIGGISISDIILYDHSVTNRLLMTAHFQQEDFLALGKLLLALACGSLIAIYRENIETSLDVMSRTYSKDLKNLIEYLLSPTNQKRCIQELMPIIGVRFLSQMDATQTLFDTLQREISKEANSKRLLRLIIKLSIINEGHNENYSALAENNGKNPLQLFKDYLYQQVTDDQRPFFSMARIIQCLSKLDSGSTEKICLMPKDEDPAVVMSYEEIKQCFDKMFKDISYYAVYLDDEADVMEANLVANTAPKT